MPDFANKQSDALTLGEAPRPVVMFRPPTVTSVMPKVLQVTRNLRMSASADTVSTSLTNHCYTSCLFLRYLRRVLVLMFAMCVTLQIFAAGQPDPAPTWPLSEMTYWGNLDRYSDSTGRTINSYTEAPMLYEMVKVGVLPPIEERIAKEPAVVRPFEKIGRYGGTLDVVTQRSYPSSTDPYVYRETLLGRGRPDVVHTLIPNIAQEWEYSADFSTLTLRLRDGHRWSDGNKFSADDFLFWYYYLNSPGYNSPVSPSSNRLKYLKKVDDTTVQFEFTHPRVDFGYVLSDPTMQVTPYAPSEYLKNYHGAYSETADQLAAEAGFDTWIKHLDYLYHSGDLTPDFPHLSPWVPETIDSRSAVYVRNPYYYKVDTNGNQLPYIDRLSIQIADDTKDLAAKAISGESDFGSGIHGGGIGIDLLPKLFERSDQTGLRVSWSQPDIKGTWRNLAIVFNHTTDHYARELIRDRRFKEALSVALDRNEINERVFFGLGQPVDPSRFVDRYDTSSPEQSSPSELSPDFDHARRLLQEAIEDHDGIHFSDDSIYIGDVPLEIPIRIAPDVATHREAAELVAGYWTRIGVSTTVADSEPILFFGDSSAVTTITELGECGGGLSALSVDQSGCNVFWGPAWQVWYDTSGSRGEKPPDELRSYFEIIDEISVASAIEERDESTRAAVSHIIDNLWTIPVVDLPAQVRYATGSLRNIDLENLPAFQFAPSAAFQWYFAE